MKILLIGASGQLGSDLLRNNRAHDIVAPDRSRVDLANAGSAAKAIAETRPNLVINCAAFHHLTRCEEDPAQAFLINAIAVREVAIACAEHDARLVTFSTDYVFGGGAREEPYRENDAPAPLQIYGISRLAGERAALAYAPGRAVVIRTCGLYGRAGSKSRGGNFVDARTADARAGKRIEMAAEQIVGAPTSTDDLSRAVLALIENAGLQPGIYHLVNEGVCSWFEFTQEIARLVGGGAAVVPVDRGGRFAGVSRPLYSALANMNARALGVTLRPWREALADYLRAKHREMPEK